MGTVTIGTRTYDVYGDADGLEEHANGSLLHYSVYSEAADADADNPARALVEATRALTIQPWDDAANADVSTASATVVTAAYELALAGLADPTIFASTTTADRTKVLDADGVMVEYFAPAAGSRFPDRVIELIGDLLAAASTSVAGSYTTGTDGESQFDRCDEFGLTRA